MSSWNLNRLAYVYIGLAIAGIGDAIYTAHDYLNPIDLNSCRINSFFNCGDVADSPYTSLFHIPFWVTGLVWFPLVLIVGLVAFRYGIDVILIPLLMIGDVFTIYLWYLELGLIHAVCPVCLSNYLISYALTGVAAWKAFS